MYMDNLGIIWDDIYGHVTLSNFPCTKFLMNGLLLDDGIVSVMHLMHLIVQYFIALSLLLVKVECLNKLKLVLKQNEK